jgi:hypothetical protein
VPVSLTLTDAQIARVVHELSATRSPVTAVGDAQDARSLCQLLVRFSEDPKYSRSTLRALAVLSAFSENGRERSLQEVAEEVELSPSTTLRYINTWVIVGALSQNPASRKYRRLQSEDTKSAYVDVR